MLSTEETLELAADLPLIARLEGAREKGGQLFDGPDKTFRHGQPLFVTQKRQLSTHYGPGEALGSMPEPFRRGSAPSRRKGQGPVRRTR